MNKCVLAGLALLCWLVFSACGNDTKNKMPTMSDIGKKRGKENVKHSATCEALDNKLKALTPRQNQINADLEQAQQMLDICLKNNATNAINNGICDKWEEHIKALKASMLVLEEDQAEIKRDIARNCN